MKANLKDFEAKMQKSCASLETELKGIRVGRASAAVLDKITVDYYGSATPINQIAAISTADARTLVITPWDASTVKEIEKAILASDLGINPQNDGKVIRLTFPTLTEERRKEVSKQVGFTVDVKSYIRYETGEGIEKKEEDFAAEVAKQMGE